MFSEILINQAKNILNSCENKHIKIATAESCTGGLIAALFTEIAGSSKVFERGFVTYSNAAKHELLGVENELLNKYGAVSAEVAKAMAEGALKQSKVDITIAVTGIAGPDGGTQEKPVGLVYIALAAKEKATIFKKCDFDGNRSDIRLSTVHAALTMIESSVSEC
ncbi:MAG: CinA family protein [Pseudomonadota bacterium]